MVTKKLITDRPILVTTCPLLNVSALVKKTSN